MECDEWVVWWLSASDSEFSSDLCSGSSSLEDSCGTLYVPLGLRDTGRGNSGAVGGRGGGRLCCMLRIRTRFFSFHLHSITFHDVPYPDSY